MSDVPESVIWIDESDDHDTRTITIRFEIGNGETTSVETKLGGLLTDTALVLPFSSKSNAIDCLRVLIRILEREDEDHSNDLNDIMRGFREQNES